MLLPVPTGLEPVSIARASDNIPDGYRTVAPHLRRWPGAPVLIVGGATRSIGLYAAGVAVAMGSHKSSTWTTIASAWRWPKASTQTRSKFPRGPSGWLGTPRQTEAATSSASTPAQALPESDSLFARLLPAAVAPALVTTSSKNAKLPLAQMYFNTATLHLGVSNPRSDLPDLLALIASRRFQPEKVTTMAAAWEEAPQAFLENTTKVVVQRSGTIA